MRNLKKFLALVLALMMTFSLMITVNAASKFSDADSITTEFDEAIKVLEGLKVFEGYPDKTFKPKNDITRAEAATIVYRLATGDVAGDKAHLYKDYGTFTDVTADHWAAGYINYCANAEWIAGYGNGKFGPNDKVTGYQAAAMILRAVGYGKNKEFTGSGWQVQTANFSRTLGLLKNVNKTTYANTLNQHATRELVAEILFQAGLINTVTWNQLSGYQPGNPVQGAGNVSNGLAWQNFRLNVGSYEVIDKWGRPGYYWFKNNTNNSANRVATIELKPALDLKGKAVKECDVAHELDIADNDTFKLYVNDNQFITDKYMIEATDTVTRVGGQGRITEFYSNATHPYKTLYGGSRADWTQSVTMIDTYLAKVTRVTERVLDPAGHVITPAYLYLDVYDGHGVGASKDSGVFFASGSAAEVNTTAHRLEDKDANWAYVAGDMILVRGYTDKYQWENAGSLDSDGDSDSNAKEIGYTLAGGAVVSVDSTAAITTGTTKLNHTVTQAAKEKAAFEPNCLLPSGGDFSGDSKLEVVGKATAQKAESKLGKQTVTYWNEDKHTVDGTDYNDAITLYLDEAGTTTGTSFAWYFDTFGNIIGIDNIPNTVNYGVITSIYSAFNQGDSATTGTAKAVANVLYADGTTGTVTVDRFLMSGTVGSGASNGHGTAGTPVTTGSNSLNLEPVYDYSTSNSVMQSASRGGTLTLAADNGYLYVAPVASINANAENNQNGNGYFGVLRGNLFKFVASSNGNVTAIEIAGNGNSGAYAGHYNASVAASSKLYKNLGYIDCDGSAATAEARLDSDALIMIRATATSNAVACYNMTTLPGDVTLTTGTEVDWVDTDNDGRAEYVYVTGTGMGTLTYGLFYYNGGAAVWDGVNKTGTLTGWLNGEPATLTFQGEKTFTAVRDSQAYAGHLFAVELTNGVVSALMRDLVNAERLLTTTASTPTSAFNTFVHPAGSITSFALGTVNGNPYDTNTRAIYYKDVTTVVGGADTIVKYDTSRNTITVGSTVTATYYLTANSKVVGLGMGVSESGAILDYLNKSNTNDVTIVYDDVSKTIVEIYVATDPNVTPSTPDATIGELTINSMIHNASSKYTVNVTSDMTLTSGTNYTKVQVSMAKWDGSNYTPLFTDLNCGIKDLTAGTADGIDVPYAAISAAGRYIVVVEYVTATGAVVASGSAYIYCS